MDRGDIYHLDLEPTRGREQAGERFVLIVSPKSFNVLGTPLLCPITQGGDFARKKGWAVSLTGAGTRTQGVVLCNQLKTVDVQARGGRFIEKLPVFLVDEVLARLQTLIE